MKLSHADTFASASVGYTRSVIAKVDESNRWVLWCGAATRVAIALVVTIVAVVSARAQLAEQAKLTPADGVAELGFGGSTAVDGDTLVVGAPFARTDDGSFQGAVYIYTRADGTWTETTKLIPPDGATGTRFGQFVALDGDTLVVRGGPVYVFTRADGTWTETATLSPSAGGLRGGIAISGDTIALGSDDSGAYVFTHSGGTWTETAKLTPPETPGGDSPLPAIAVSGDTVVVGERNQYDGPGPYPQGKAYVFTRAGGVWTETAILTASDGGSADWFGQAVALAGHTLVVGRPGAAHVFQKTGETWTETAKLTVADTEVNDTFGFSVAIGAGGLLVGRGSANIDGKENQGAAYLFTGSGSNWTETARLTAGDGMAEDDFGLAVAADGGTVVAGATGADIDANVDQGAAYVFSSFGQHFAEGATGFFQTDVGLFNPSEAEPAQVLVTLNPDTPEGAVTVPLTLEPLSRRTIDVNQATGNRGSGVSIHVGSDQPVAATRQMRWDAARTYGSTLESGAPETATAWYFAEGATYFTNLFYLIANPNNADATVTIQYLPSSGDPITQEVMVRAQSRRTIWANAVDGLEYAEVAAVISADQPIVAERAMYLGPTFEAGTVATGATALSAEWSFAEGSTAFFDTFLTLGNPGDASAEVTITYQLPNGETVTKMHEVPAASRRTILVDQEDQQLASTPLAMRVSSSAPIIAERVMWWGPTSEFWYEGHAALGSTDTGTVWAVGEGASGGSMAEDTYVLVANASEDAGQVRLRVVDDEGTTAEQTLTLAAQQRLTVRIREVFPEAENRRFSLLVESVGVGEAPPVPITVEYVRYQSTDGRFGNGGGAALATRLQ